MFGKAGFVPTTESSALRTAYYGKLSTGLFLVLSFYCLSGPYVRGQVNLSGKPGLLYVPSADYTDVGTLRMGALYNPKAYALGAVDRNAEIIMFANLTILPRLDININVLKAISTPQYPIIKDLGDRQLDIRYLLLKEKRHQPSVAIIMSSPFTVDALMLTHVIVATKTLKLNSGWQAKMTLGLGSPYFVYRNASVSNNSSVFTSFKWQKKSEYRHNNHYLVGLFGGIRLDFREKVGLMLEYDSQRPNVGVYARLFERWNIQAGLINFDKLTFGTAYSFALSKPNRRLKQLYDETR